MNAITPNKWTVVRLNLVSGEVLYKIFGTWSGDYLNGDSWKFNSGVNKVEYHDDHYIFQGYSSSSYKGSKSNYGVAGLSNYPVLENLVDELRNHPKVKEVGILSWDEVQDWLETHQ